MVTDNKPDDWNITMKDAYVYVGSLSVDAAQPADIVFGHQHHAHISGAPAASGLDPNTGATVIAEEGLDTSGEELAASQATVARLQAEQDAIFGLMLADIDQRLANISRHTDGLLAGYNLA